MSAEVQYLNGQAQAFTVRVPAWWDSRESRVLAEAPDFETALKEGGLDYEVVKVPTFREIVAANGTKDYVENTKAFITKRTDTGQELGSVGPDYVVVQNREAFAVLEPLIQEGVATAETGGVLRDGADAWLMLKFDLDRFEPIVREVFTDEVVPFALISTNHSGRRKLLASLTPIRVVCANTLGAVEQQKDQAIYVSHRGDAQERLVEAAHGLWGGIVERYTRLAQRYAALKARILTEQEFASVILDVIAPDPRTLPSFNPDAKLAASVVARAEKRRTELRRLWDEGAGHTGDHSAWEGWNGAVEAIDHNRDLFPLRAGTWRTASLLDGKLRHMKDAALVAVSRLAGYSDAPVSVQDD